MEILAHRANLEGPNRSTENSFAAVQAALAAGFGIETDIRRDENRRYYIAHDRMAHSAERDLERYSVAFREFPDLTIAMNVKELGYEDQLIEMQLRGDFGDRSFLFDFELLEPLTPGRTQTFIRSLPNGEKSITAARVSDRGESLGQCLAIPAEVVWLDEFDSFWATADLVRDLKSAGRRVYVVSPELHGYDDEKRLSRWADFQTWGIDGVCTDFPLAARKFFKG